MPGEENPVQGARAALVKRRCVSACLKRSETKVAKHGRPPPRKAAMACRGPVPQTDTGGQGENPEAGGRSTAKELGKTAP